MLRNISEASFVCKYYVLTQSADFLSVMCLCYARSPEPYKMPAVVEWFILSAAIVCRLRLLMMSGGEIQCADVCAVYNDGVCVCVCYCVCLEMQQEVCTNFWGCKQVV
jgi:hypothetical protein